MYYIKGKYKSLIWWPVFGFSLSQCISESLERLTNKQKGVENYCRLSCAARADAGSAAKRSKSHRKGSHVRSTDETSPRFMCAVKTCSFLQAPVSSNSPSLFLPLCIIWLAHLFSLPSHVSSSGFLCYCPSCRTGLEAIMETYAFWRPPVRTLTFEDFTNMQKQQGMQRCF